MVWMNFVDPDQPEESAFLGAVIAPCNNVVEGAQWAWNHDINPGGEVFAHEIGDCPQEYVGRLLSEEDIDRFKLRPAQ